MASRSERYLQMGAERSVALSPLLNLAPSPGTAATMKQHVRLVQLAGSGIAGSAELILSPDRRTLDVRLRLERPRAVSIELRSMESDDGEPLLIVEITAGGASGHAWCRGKRFQLDSGLRFGAFDHAEDLREVGLGLAGLRSDSIKGIDVAPAKRGSGRSYFAERMLTEIAAAEASASAVAASRHVELANLYARHLLARDRIAARPNVTRATL
jgi:hypothetical protein